MAKKKSKVRSKKPKLKRMPAKKLPAKKPKAKIKRSKSRPKSKSSIKQKVKTAGAYQPSAGEIFAGEITHYFPKVWAAVLAVACPILNIGDKIRIVGHTTNFDEQVASMQIDRVPIQSAKKGDEIGILVKKRARKGDKIYKLA
jgi:putative protease